MKLNGNVAFITGGARIGAVVAEELAKRGCHVALSYRSSKESAERTSMAVEGYGVKSFIVQADTSNESSVSSAIAKTAKKFGRLNIVINMASIYEQTPTTKLTDKQWEDNIKINLKSSFLTVKHATPFLKKSSGRVVNFSDWVAASGRPRYKNFVPYYTSKSAVVGLTQAQALELAPHVLVNAIAPGPILPPPHLTTKERRDVEKATPLGRWGGAEEIAKAVVFLCETDFVTGEVLRVDGGRHLY